MMLFADGQLTPPTPDISGSNLAWVIGLSTIIGAISTAVVAIIQAIYKNRKEQKEAEEEYKAKASEREAKERTGTIGEYQKLAERQDEQLRMAATHANAQQAAINRLERRCSSKDLTISEMYSTITIFHGVICRQAAQLKDHGLNCEDIPSLPPRPMRENGEDDPGYIVRRSMQNDMLQESARKKLAEKSVTKEAGKP